MRVHLEAEKMMAIKRTEHMETTNILRFHELLSTDKSKMTEEELKLHYKIVEIVQRRLGL